MKWVKLILIISFVTVLSSCSNKNTNELSNYDKIQSNLINMKGYKCEANVKYISNKGENNYETRQYCKITGEYKIETTSPKEVEGNIILFDGKMIWQYNPRVEGKISVNMPDKPARREILLSSFVENYVKSKDVSIESSNTDEGMCTVLEAKIPGDLKFFDSEKLWVNNESKLPYQLVVYDTEGKERIMVTFKNFEFNPKFDENTFKMY